MQSHTTAPIRRLSRRHRIRDFAMIVVSLLALVLMAIWLLLPVGPVSAQEIPSNGNTLRQITVSGSAQVLAEPNTAYVTLGVETTAETASTALDDNNAQMQTLLDALREFGIADEHLRTQTLRLVPQYDHSQAGEPSVESQPVLPPPPDREISGELTGYRAVNTVQITIVDDLAQIGELIDMAVASGANSIRGISFDVESSTNLLDQARQEAWAEAQHKAEQLATLAGASLGSVLTVNENSTGMQPIVQESFESAAAATVPIQPGTQPIRVDLYITWELAE